MREVGGGLTEEEEEELVRGMQGSRPFFGRYLAFPSGLLSSVKGIAYLLPHIG